MKPGCLWKRQTKAFPAAYENTDETTPAYICKMAVKNHTLQRNAELQLNKNNTFVHLHSALTNLFKLTQRKEYESKWMCVW